MFEEDDKYKRIKDLEHLLKDDDRIMVYYIDWMYYSNISGNWLKKHILWVFWNNNKVTELCEKWIFYGGNYANTRFEELCTCSGEVLFTREHKATLSKEKSLTYIDIDAFKVFRNKYFQDEIVLKTKKKYKSFIDKVNKKITKLRWNKMLKTLSEKVKKKINLINKLRISKLEKNIYIDDLRSELDELNKIDAKTDATADDALSVICNMMCKKNRKRLKEIDTDRKVELLDKVYDLLEHIINEIKSETDEIYTKMCNVNGLDKDALRLINDKLNEIMTQSKKYLIKIKDILC